MKKTKTPWDSGLPAVEVTETVVKPKRKYKRRNKKATAKVYMMAYKQVLKGLSKEARAMVLDANKNNEITRQFAKTVIALAEQDDK